MIDIASSHRRAIGAPTLPIASAFHSVTNPCARYGLVAEWATSWRAVRDAQRLRYRVFAEELGARLPPGRSVAALLKGYLRLGARVLGPPAWDPDFGCADLPLLLRLDDIPQRYRRHLLGVHID
jgi:putative hemolysin